jgi:ketosteroid isomerase-like protein
MSRRNVEIIRAGYEAFLRGDLETAFSVFAEDIEAVDDPAMIGQRVYVGKEGFARMLAATTEGFDDVRYHADRFTDAGDSVLVDARRSGRGTLSGVTVEEHQHHVWDMRDGHAVRFRLFLSRDDALAALDIEAEAESKPPRPG